MDALTIKWETIDKMPVVEKEKKAAPVLTGENVPAPAAQPADDPATQDKSALGTDKPYVVYITDGDQAMNEKVILDDDRVKLGSHAFHMVKMTNDQAKADPVLTDKGGKEVPRMILVSADQKIVKPLEGNLLKLGEVWGGMKAVADKFYKNDLDGVVRDLRNVLNEFDKVNKERIVQDDKEKRLGDKISDKDKKEIAAKRAELDARQKKAEESRDKLLDLKAKVA